MTEILLPPEHPWKDRIQVFDRLPSTNTYAKALAADGAPEGTVVIAGEQTGGRGRMGRTFSSPAGQGIYLSAILRPRCRPEELMHLTCAVAVAMADAVQSAAGITPGIKWINDLILSGKKLGGILTELCISPNGEVSSAVVGIGINCRQTCFPEELGSIATSLRIETGKDILPEVLASAMIRHLQKLRETLFSEKARIMERYGQLCVTTGRQVTWIQGSETFRGFAEKVNEDGSLTIRFGDGHREDVQSGEVSVRLADPQ